LAKSDSQEYELEDEARARLDQALADLERIVDDKAAQAVAAGDKSIADVAVLKAENGHLKFLIDDISMRLDATIERLQVLLKG
jgi:hypothetical protein